MLSPNTDGIPDYEEVFNSNNAKNSDRSLEMTTIPLLELNDLKNRSTSLESEVKLLNSLLEEMRKEFRDKSEKLLSELEKDSSPQGNGLQNCVGAVKVNEDQYYFSSYAGYDIHHEMLSVRIVT